MNADPLPPHFGALTRSGKPGYSVVSVNCSQPRGPGGPACAIDGLTISSAGLPLGLVAVRVYAGHVQGTTILSAASRYSGHSVVDRHNLPIGTWKETKGAGWLMSGLKSEPALTFTVSGSATPSKVVFADGSEAHGRPGAPITELPTVVQRHLANSTQWDPPLIMPGSSATVVASLAGAHHGDLTMCAHTSVRVGIHRVQLSAIAGEGVVEVVLLNVGKEPVDVPLGQLRVAVTKLVWPEMGTPTQLKTDDEAEPTAQLQLGARQLFLDATALQEVRGAHVELQHPQVSLAIGSTVISATRRAHVHSLMRVLGIFH
jgi:hypothetical protein